MDDLPYAVCELCDRGLFVDGNEDPIGGWDYDSVDGVPLCSGCIEWLSKQPVIEKETKGGGGNDDGQQVSKSG